MTHEEQVSKFLQNLRPFLNFHIDKGDLQGVTKEQVERMNPWFPVENDQISYGFDQGILDAIPEYLREEMNTIWETGKWDRRE